MLPVDPLGQNSMDDVIRIQIKSGRQYRTADPEISMLFQVVSASLFKLCSSDLKQRAADQAIKAAGKAAGVIGRYAGLFAKDGLDMAQEYFDDQEDRKSVV